MVVPLGLEDPGMRCGVGWRRTWSRRGQRLRTSKPTEGEVPPAGCAGVVCANETNKKKTKWRAFSLLRIAGERGKRGGGGGVIYSTQHARSSSHKI